MRADIQADEVSCIALYVKIDVRKKVLDLS